MKSLNRAAPVWPAYSLRVSRSRDLWLALFTQLFAAVCLTLYTISSSASVKVSEQDLIIPTYLAGAPEPNPMFYFGRGSQGAEGRVYPYPLYDSLTHLKSNKTYRLVYLENEYVRIGILPEIGGRLFEGIDKSNGYDFVYRQHVIKPALIGLIGAWISGGIEWNIPHHHRATTFLPVQYRITEQADGSKTVWVGELELRHRMRWAVGYTLHPEKSYLECSVRIVNRTPFANTMLCFANVAVHVNQDYQVIYPPSTRFVTFHSKREFASWPIARSVYNGADFTRGVDVSWYSNHFDANSMFAWNYEDDFFAGYDHGRQAGLMSVANHQVVPGKKFWTWGNGPRGRMWDTILTDSDGPYIELMVGAYSDNQPDYSWLQPYETKSFQMYWYPFRDIGGVKLANIDAAVNLELTANGLAQVGFCTTAVHRRALARVTARDKVLFEEQTTVSPAKPLVRQIAVPAGVTEYDLRASLSADGKELVAYSPARLAPANPPEPVKPPPAPKDIPTVEELYLAGQRIEQFHHPNLEPEPYWEEALRRDPGDARANTSLGLRQLKQARFAEAEQHFRQALARLTANYTSPKDGEPFYYLGVALKAQAKTKEAADAFYRATWSEAWRGPAYYALAELATGRGDYSTAQDCVERSLAANALNVRALALKATLLRQQGRCHEALPMLAEAARVTDPLDVRLLAERWLAGDKVAAKELAATLQAHPATGLETAVDFANAGRWADGRDLLNYLIAGATNAASVSPLVYYYLGQFGENQRASAEVSNARPARAPDRTAPAECWERARAASPDYVFPFQWEAISALQRALEVDPNDARAAYYLGNLLFDWQPEAAVPFWEKSARLDPSFPIVHRNLALAYWHARPTNDTARAIAELEQAVAAPVKYALHFTELDELYAAVRTPPEKRLALLEHHHSVVAKRDDALAREIGLKVFAGKYDDAIQLMTGRRFAVWEGGSLDVADQWLNAHLWRGRQRLYAHQFSNALADFKAAQTIPSNLPSERAVSGHDAELAYWTGAAFEALGDTNQARQYWLGATEASISSRHRASDGRLSEKQAQSYCQALAHRKLGREKEAEASLRELLASAQDALKKGASESGARLPLAHYLAGLGQLGLGQTAEARTEFAQALKEKPDYLEAKANLELLNQSNGHEPQ